jgi:hypothetical protein
VCERERKRGREEKKRGEVERGRERWCFYIEKNVYKMLNWILIGLGEFLAPRRL